MKTKELTIDNLNIPRLKEREREILRMYYGIGGGEKFTLGQVAEKFNLTSERIRQLKEKSIRSIRWHQFETRRQVKNENR